MSSISSGNQTPQQHSPIGEPARSTTSTPAGERRARTRRFWSHHPVLLTLLILLIGFTSYERWNPNAPSWYLLLCSALVIGLGLYEISTFGATRTAAYDRDPNRTYAWMPMPKTPTGVRILGVVMVLVGLLAGGTTIAGV